MTPRATLYPKPETNFISFNNADLRICFTYKMVLWSPKMRIQQKQGIQPGYGVCYDAK